VVFPVSVGEDGVYGELGWVGLGSGYFVEEVFHSGAEGLFLGVLAFVYVGVVWVSCSVSIC